MHKPRCPFISTRKVIRKVHTDVPTHILLPFFGLLPSQTEFAEESIPYFGPDQNFRKFETSNVGEKNWKNSGSAYVRTSDLRKSDLSNRSVFTIPTFYSVVNMNPNQTFCVAIGVFLLQIMNYCVLRVNSLKKVSPSEVIVVRSKS